MLDEELSNERTTKRRVNNCLNVWKQINNGPAMQGQKNLLHYSQPRRVTGVCQIWKMDFPDNSLTNMSLSLMYFIVSVIQ